MPQRNWKEQLSGGVGVSAEIFSFSPATSVFAYHCLQEIQPKKERSGRRERGILTDPKSSPYHPSLQKNDSSIYSIKNSFRMAWKFFAISLRLDPSFGPG